MKTKHYHISNLGSFGHSIPTDANGYVTYHDSPRYAKATEDQLEAWAMSRSPAVRAAARTEQAERALEQWRNATR